jgi:hypothetical protein
MLFGPHSTRCTPSPDHFSDQFVGGQISRILVRAPSLPFHELQHHLERIVMTGRDIRPRLRNPDFRAIPDRNSQISFLIIDKTRGQKENPIPRFGHPPAFTNDQEVEIVSTTYPCHLSVYSRGYSVPGAISYCCRVRIWWVRQCLKTFPGTSPISSSNSSTLRVFILSGRLRSELIQKVISQSRDFRAK